jgi:hypothetical protein
MRVALHHPSFCSGPEPPRLLVIILRPETYNFKKETYERIQVLRILTAEGGRHPGAIVRELDWMQSRRVSNLAVVTALQVELDAGEAEAIALAQELPAAGGEFLDHAMRPASFNGGGQIFGYFNNA